MVARRPPQYAQLLEYASNGWLGRFADSDKVRTSGLWNVNYVDETYDSSYLDQLERLVTEA